MSKDINSILDKFWIFKIKNGLDICQLIVDNENFKNSKVIFKSFLTNDSQFNRIKIMLLRFNQENKCPISINKIEYNNDQIIVEFIAYIMR